MQTICGYTTALSWNNCLTPHLLLGGGGGVVAAPLCGPPQHNSLLALSSTLRNALATQYRLNLCCETSQMVDIKYTLYSLSLSLTHQHHNPDKQDKHSRHPPQYTLPRHGTSQRTVRLIKSPSNYGYMCNIICHEYSMSHGYFRNSTSPRLHGSSDGIANG